jgi:hypothetical protein
VSALTSSDSDWTKLLQLGNYYQENWANEPGVDWRSLYQPAVSNGAVTATDTFALGSTIHKISLNENDPIRIVWTNGTSYTNYTLIPADQLKFYENGSYVAKVGASLKFNRAFVATDPEFGGTIKVPAYTLPYDLDDAVNNPTGLISVDDPNWLVTICAAEYVRNDLVRQNQYPNLLSEANELMKKMTENNGSQQQKIVMRSVGVARTF